MDLAACAHLLAEQAGVITRGQVIWMRRDPWTSGPDLLRASDGVDPQPQWVEPTLTAAPWAVLGVATLGLLAAAMGLRALVRPERRRRRGLIVGRVLSITLALVCAPLP